MDFKSIHGQWQICFGPTAVGMGNVVRCDGEASSACVGGGGGAANRINKRREYSPLPCTSVKQVTHVLPLNRIIKIRRQTQGDIDGLDSLKATRPTRKILARCFPAILEIFRPSVVLSGPKKSSSRCSAARSYFLMQISRCTTPLGTSFFFFYLDHIDPAAFFGCGSSDFH